MFVIAHRTFFFWLTGAILAASLAAIALWGLPLGIDFTGGTQMEVRFVSERPAIEAIQADVALVAPTASVRSSGTDAINIRASELTPEDHNEILAALRTKGEVVEESYTTVGPSLGSQFTSKALWAILAVALVIVLYIAFAFRKVSKPVPSWGYGITVVAMLAIDIIVPAGFFAAYAHFTGAEVDSLFVVALLALLGYCVNDVIVVFDRVREHLARNIKEGIKETFEETVGKSISETLTRSINTSLTVALALLALIYLGAPATRNFALIMLVGVIAGTFSSICRSAPLLIPLAKRFSK
jgi:preprotein translocase subunit SecF